MKIKQVAFTLLGSLAVFVACSAQKVADRNGPDGVDDDSGVIGALRDSGMLKDVLSMVDDVKNELKDSTGIDISPYPADAEAAPPDYAAGSRIKPKYQTTSFGDGASGKVFAGWYDSGRSEDCFVQTAADGKLRCMPGGGVTGYSYFSDSACTTPIYFQATASVGCATPPMLPKYADIGPAPDSCATRPVHLAPVTGVGTNPAKWYLKSGTTCLDAGAFPSTGYRVLTIGAEIPASSFVEATVTTTTSP